MILPNVKDPDRYVGCVVDFNDHSCRFDDRAGLRYTVSPWKPAVQDSSGFARTAVWN